MDIINLLEGKHLIRHAGEKAHSRLTFSFPIHGLNDAQPPLEEY